MALSSVSSSDKSFMAYPTGGGINTATGVSTPWEDQRREARRVENTLDTKLGQFSKLCSGYEQSYSCGEGGLATDQLMDSKAAELERLLSQLSDVNDRMKGTLAGRSDTRSHTLTRHRDILHDYQQLDEVMGTASAISGKVSEQSQLFENIGNKVLAVGAKFPAIIGVINAVRRKKSKDTIILASVIAVCTVLILIYWISKH